MSDKRCPSQEELLAFVDLDLPPEKLGRIEIHLEACSVCKRETSGLRDLIQDVVATPPGPKLQLAAHVAGILQRLDGPRLVSDAVPAVSKAPARWIAWSGGLAAAAALCLMVYQRQQPSAVQGQFVSRGATAEPSLSRDVGVQLYTQNTSIQALSSGGKIRAASALTAGLRNLGEQPAYLLLFAVDAKQVVHWIAPEYTALGSDPQAAPILPSARERLLPSAAIFDDLQPGPLRVIAVITRAPARVSNVERLGPDELGAEGLLKRFPDAEIRQYLLEVVQ